MCPKNLHFGGVIRLIRTDSGREGGREQTSAGKNHPGIQRKSRVPRQHLTMVTGSVNRKNPAYLKGAGR
jgi:hypothetical protein